MKLAIIDIETNGLDPRKHEILEIGCVVFETDSLDVLDRMNFKIKMERPEDGDPKAYAVNGWKAEDWTDAIPLAEALVKLSRRVEGAKFCAYNVTFDWSFIEEASRKTGVSHGLHYHKVDLLSLAFSKSKKIMTMSGACQYFGIDPENSIHRALAGAEKEFELYKKVMS